MQTIRIGFVLNSKKDPKNHCNSGKTESYCSQTQTLSRYVFFFDETLTLQTFCKTQFGGIEAHIEVIEFLHTIEEFFLDFWVIDEGDYWTTNDELLLKEKMGIMSKILDEVEKSLREQNKENKWKYN